ncbi:hypothetical protein AGMMS50239_12540 [Bacteroidia bacterium]|nr:hypothetical protein AGMMS50239_12540 [Bacteroidia bacterium]
MIQMKDIHIGTIIKQKFQKKSMTIGEFANNIHHSRTGIYALFKKKSIDTELLINISRVLDYDFIHEVYLPKNDLIGINWKDIEPSKMMEDLMELLEKIRRVRKNNAFVRKNDTNNGNL